MSYFRVVKQDGKMSAAFGLGSKSYSVDESNPNFDTIVESLIAEDYEEAVRLFDLSQSVAKEFTKVSERVSVANGRVYFDGVEVENALTNQILNFLRNGENFNPLVNFMEKLYVNTNEYVREQLFKWVDNRNLTILPDGDFVAYKGVTKVDGVYRSIHSGSATVDGKVHDGQIPNPIGSVIEMPRDKVNNNPDIGCSTGLHVGTFSFAKNFGQGPVLTIAVNPRDVVSVPRDSNNQKVRTCRYRVLDVTQTELTEPVLATPAAVNTAKPKAEKPKASGGFVPLRLNNVVVRKGLELRSRKTGHRSLRVHSIKGADSIEVYDFHRKQYRTTSLSNLRKSYYPA